jgi:hypothetical protein
MEKPSFVIGNIAKGKDLWNRHEEIKIIWKALEKTSVLLKAPRRFGKTSIMYRIYEEPLEGFKTFFLDTEGMAEPQDFLSALMTKILSDSKMRSKIYAIGKWIKNITGKIDEIEIADVRLKIKNEIRKDWKAKGLDFISRLSEYDGKILFIVDELPVLIQNIKKKSGKESAHDFLHWFRAVRQTPELSKVRWLVGGSIGIEHILQKVEAGTKVINDFQIIRIGAFSIENAKEYIKNLLKNEGQIKRLPTSIIGKFLKLIGAPIPYFIQILAKESLYEMERQKYKTLNDEIIDKAYREEVLGPASKTYFEHYFTRLKDYYDETSEKVAKRLILEVARKGEVKKSDLFRLFRHLSKGELNDEVFSHVMTDIENDFYVSFNLGTNSYSFTTNVLRDWWLRYYDLVEE